MQSEIKKVLKLKNFFNILSLNEHVTKYRLNNSSKILLHNVNKQWITSIWQKTSSHYPIFLNSPKKYYTNKENKLPVGYIDNMNHNLSRTPIIEHDLSEFLPKTHSTLRLNVLMAETEMMQYFLQWQRYRKYWWSTITTSAGLFSLSDIKYQDNTTEVDVLVHLPWGKEIVEHIKICKHDELQTTHKEPVARLESVMTLEGALLTLLLDGLMNYGDDEYLRLNRIMAPYKMSFAIDSKDTTVTDSLHELATLLNFKLTSNNVSTWLPDFSTPLEKQLTLCCHMGVAYTAVINDKTLVDGIFHLMNSSTMLKEQIHVADFESYTKLLCS